MHSYVRFDGDAGLTGQGLFRNGSAARTVDAPRAGLANHLCAKCSASRGMTNANIDPLSCSLLRLPRKVGKQAERQRETDGALNLTIEMAVAGWLDGDNVVTRLTIQETFA